MNSVLFKVVTIVHFCYPCEESFDVYHGGPTHGGQFTGPLGAPEAHGQERRPLPVPAQPGEPVTSDVLSAEAFARIEVGALSEGTNERTMQISNDLETDMSLCTLFLY